jgi:hypothetical protein
MPFANITVPKVQTFASEVAPMASTETRPTITVSTKPSSMLESWVTATGSPSAAILRISLRSADTGFLGRAARQSTEWRGRCLGSRDASP